MCQEQILILSCSSPTCPPLFRSLSLSLMLPLSLYLPSLSPVHISLICFPSKSSSFFIPFPVRAVSVCVCVCTDCECVCKSSLFLSLSDVQQLLEGSFSFAHSKRTHTYAQPSFAPALTYFPNTSL